MKRKIIKTVIGVLIVATVGLGGYFGYSYYKSQQKTSTTTQNYITMTASKMKLSVNVQGTGTVIGDSTDILPSANGDLKDFNLKVGDTVKAGTKIAAVSADQLQSSVLKAQNNLEKQRLQLSNLKNSLNNAQTQLSNAKNDLATLQAQLQTATGVDVKTLNDKISNLQNQITTQTNNIANYQNQIATQNINISDAQNDLNSSTTQLDKTTIIAPMDGVVTAVNNKNGDTVQQGKAIATIVNQGSFKIKVSVDELDIAKVKVGEVAQVTFGALKDKVFTGKVDTVSMVGNTSNNVTNYDVTIALDNNEGVQLGMTANVNIEVASKEEALVIPAEALVERNGEKYVMVPSDSTQPSASTKTEDQTKGQAADVNKQETQGQGTDTNKSQAQSKNQSAGGNRTQGQGNWQGTGGTNTQNKGQRQTGTPYSGGRLVKITTGLQNENYIEVISGIDAGQKLLVTLPKTTSGTSTQNRQGGSGFGGGGFGGGSFGGSQNTQKSSGTGNKSK